MNRLVKWDRCFRGVLKGKTSSWLSLGVFFLSVSAFSGDVPRPFENPNRKVELAAGENYLLQGKLLVEKDGDVWFFVDLREHPWLATKERIGQPYYRLDVDAGFDIQKYKSRLVQVPVRANGQVLRDLVKGYIYQIKLKLLSEPRLVERDRQGN